MFGFKTQNYQSYKLAQVPYYQIRKRSTSQIILSYSQKQFKLSKSSKIITLIGLGNCLIDRVNIKVIKSLCTSSGIQQVSRFLISTRIRMIVNANSEAGLKKMTKLSLETKVIISRYLSWLMLHLPCQTTSNKLSNQLSTYQQMSRYAKSLECAFTETITSLNIFRSLNIQLM